MIQIMLCSYDYDDICTISDFTSPKFLKKVMSGISEQNSKWALFEVKVSS